MKDRSNQVIGPVTCEVMVRPKFTMLVWAPLLLPLTLTAQSTERVDVGGYELEAVVMGTGGPTVVFESDIGTSLEVWRQVQALVSDVATTVAYSRAGLGASDMSPAAARSPDSVAEELRTLLTGLGLRPPYILVGHSFGSLLSRAFYYQHPDEVVGLVLIEDTHERLFKEVLATDPFWTPNPAPWDDQARLDEVAMLRRIEDTASLPNSRPLAGLPVHILTRGRPSRGSASEALILPVSRRLHAELFSDVTDGAHIVVDTDHHFIHLTDPEVVARSVRQVIDAVGSSGGR